MALIQTFDVFQKEWSETWNKYVALHKELDAYRGIEITETNIHQVNKIIGDLQDTFGELYGSINFVLQRYALCVQANTEYKKFMDDIKSSGAVPEDGKAPMEQGEASA